MNGYFPMELFPNLDNILDKMRIFFRIFRLYRKERTVVLYVNEICDSKM